MKAYDDKLKNVQNLAEESDHKRYTFKARSMPEYCRPGLYKKLIQDPVDYWRSKMELIKEMKNSVPPQPYYSTMPERFQVYEKRKLEKQEALKGQFQGYEKPKHGSLTYGVDFKRYFEGQQLAFARQLLLRKARINQELKNQSQEQQAFAFTTELDPNRKKHNCFLGHEEPKQMKRKPYKFSTNHVHNSHKNCCRLPDSDLEYRKASEDAEGQHEAFIYNPADYLQHRSLPRKIIERDILMNPSEVINCDYARGDQLNSLTNMLTDKSHTLEEPRYLRVIKDARL